MVLIIDRVLSMPYFLTRNFDKNSIMMVTIKVIIKIFRYLIFSSLFNLQTKSLVASLPRGLFSLFYHSRFFNYIKDWLFLAKENPDKVGINRIFIGELISYLFEASLASFIFSFNLASWSSLVIAPTTSSPTILPFLSTTIVVG